MIPIIPPPLPYYSSFNVTTLTVTEFPQILARLGHQACTHTYTTDVPAQELHKLHSGSPPLVSTSALLPDYDRGEGGSKGRIKELGTNLGCLGGVRPNSLDAWVQERGKDTRRGQ